LKPKTRNFIRYTLPAILWTALVLAASGGWLSGAQTGGLLSALLAMFGSLPIEVLGAIHFLLRKLAHLTEYGILAWLLYRARAQTQTIWNPSWARFALLGVLMVATIDELHQHFVPARVGSIVDVMIDMVGAALALGILRRFSARRQAATLETAAAK
jgi:VanZ family protein